jgi:hypothetical protein
MEGKSAADQRSAGAGESETYEGQSTHMPGENVSFEEALADALKNMQAALKSYQGLLSAEVTNISVEKGGFTGATTLRVKILRLQSGPPK